jgi:hypothetical protein
MTSTNTDSIGQQWGHRRGCVPQHGLVLNSASNELQSTKQNFLSFQHFIILTAFVLSWHIIRMRLRVLSYRMLYLWPSPQDLHANASRGTLASRVVTSCRNCGIRRRGLTHPTADLFSLFVWNFDVMTILCHNSRFLSLCTFVVTNLADFGLLTLCTFLAMTGAVNLWICVLKLFICEVMNMQMCGLVMFVVLICFTDCSGCGRLSSESC